MLGSTIASKKINYERVDVTESQLIGFEVNRRLYFWTILVISVVALLGNLLVIRTAIFRKYKYLQKTCIISLAISDIMTVLLFAMNNLDLLSKKPMTWIYGEFLCHYLPVGQVLGNLTSSVALLVIALDRYHNVIYALSKKWNPPLWKCLCGAFLLWILCTGAAYPVVKFYMYIPITMNDKDSALCSGLPVIKSTILLYYGCMNCLFFIPIVNMFFWFYYKIALLIWRHRRPPAAGYNHPDETETSSGTKAQDFTTPNSCAKKKNVQMQRKIRSFKIVVALIIAFIGCRAPYWGLMLYQQLNVVDRNVVWNVRFSVICLYLLNCVLNPLLYTFLNITIIICRKVNHFLTTTCCCWFSNSEFEDFETGKPIEGVLMDAKKNAGVVGTKDKLNNDRLGNVQFIAIPPSMPKYTTREVY